MKAPDAAVMVADTARLDGYLTAVRVLIDRHSAFATAADLMRLFAPDAPGFLMTALYQPGTREALIELSAKLDALAQSDDATAAPCPDLSIRRDPHSMGTRTRELWFRISAAAPDVAREGQRRVETLMSIERLTDCGRTLAEAVALVAAASDIPAQTIMAWRVAVKGVPCADWFPTLAFADAGGVAPASAAA